MQKSKLFLSTLSLTILLTACGTTPDATPTPTEVKPLTLNKIEFVRGEKITAKFNLKAESVQPDAWIGLIPSEIPHGKETDAEGKYITYDYLKSATAGEKALYAPSKPGSYDIRIYSSDAAGDEVASQSFTVKTASASEAKLTVDKSTVAPNEQIKVTFTAPEYDNSAWIGLIPSEIEHGSEQINDEHDLTYQYLEGKTSGTLTFNAPEKAGKYDFRLNNSDGANAVEINYITFEVK